MIKKYRRGFMLIGVLALGALISLLILGLTVQSQSQIKKMNHLIIEKKLWVMAQSGVETFLWQKKYQPVLLTNQKPIHLASIRKNYAPLLAQAYREELAGGVFYLVYGQKGDVLSVAFLKKNPDQKTARVVLYHDGIRYVPWQ